MNLHCYLVRSVTVFKIQHMSHCTYCVHLEIFYFNNIIAQAVHNAIM